MTITLKSDIQGREWRFILNDYKKKHNIMCKSLQSYEGLTAFDEWDSNDGRGIFNG